ncbi:MAG: Lrp/AsnC ligand binding domain-containing protein, partial [Paludibacteraceae bacterium]|nr:Lrp/AsnC ligand binding domain-containing protein [Paludibacteraceae bacterium]
KQHNRDYMLAFVEAVSNIPEITECYNISGDSDYMIKIRVKDMDHYSRFVQDTLGTIESIGSLHSLFVLKQEK